MIDTILCKVDTKTVIKFALSNMKNLFEIASASYKISLLCY